MPESKPEQQELPPQQPHLTQEEYEAEKLHKRELQKEIDSRSVYVGNVDFQTTPEELQIFFNEAGLINRITILNDKFTGRPKGYAYIEFDSIDSILKLLELNGVEFKNRIIKVDQKRTNLPGRAIRGFRGRGRRGGGGARFRTNFPSRIEAQLPVTE